MHEKFTEKLKTYKQQLKLEDLNVENFEDDPDDEEPAADESLMDILGGSPTPSLEEIIQQEEAEDVVIDNKEEIIQVEEHTNQDDDIEISQEFNEELEIEETPDEDMETFYLEEDECNNSESNYTGLNSGVDILEDKSDSYFCEMCSKYIKLKVKNHVCSSELIYQ